MPGSIHSPIRLAMSDAPERGTEIYPGNVTSSWTGPGTILVLSGEGLPPEDEPEGGWYRVWKIHRTLADRRAELLVRAAGIWME